ncbi:MAG: DUF3084 domain-containing protein [Nodosilinea sp.]
MILAVLILGGGIATLGDRIGMRVGKARLSLFNLRPRQTATLVSIATGSVISASTLAILFGVSSQLRTGVFELGTIQADLTAAEADLAAARASQENVQEDLASSTKERERALARLQEINQSLDQAVAQQQQTQGQLQQTRDQLSEVSQQAQALRQSTDVLRTQRDQLLRQQATIDAQIASRDQDIAKLDREIAERDQAIAEREQRLAQLEAQQGFLEQQVADLQNQYQGLFRGNIALSRNQELLSGIVRAENQEQAAEFMAQFLYEANRVALQAVAPGSPADQQVILIGNQEIERLINRISTGEEYVIRLLSAANYVTGEPCVARGKDPCIQVFVDATPNQAVYQTGERLATVALDPPPFNDRELVERLNLLVVATQFRAQQDGVASDTLQVADNRTETILQFLQTVKQNGQPVELQTLAANEIYTAGPLRVELAAVRDGQVILTTRRFASPSSGDGGVPSNLGVPGLP